MKGWNLGYRLAWAVMSLAGLLCMSCGGGGGGGTEPQGTAPRISNLTVSPDIIFYLEGDGTSVISAQMDFVDPDLDITKAWIQYYDGSRTSIALPPIGVTAGTLVGDLTVGNTQLGTFTSQVWLEDAAGHSSNRLSVDVSVVVDTNTWLDRTPAGMYQLNDVVWNGSQFVAVGYGGAILTSPDGITWTNRDSGSTQSLNGVSWDGSRFLVAGDAATVLSSPDGVTWTTLHTGADEIRLQAVSASGTRLVAAGVLSGPNTAYVLTSADGLTWSEAPSVPQSGRSVTGLAWSGQLFVASAVANAFPNDGRVLVSQDGLTWNEVVISPDSPSTLCVIWDGSRFVAGGIGGRLFMSPDGTNWTTVYTPSTSNYLGIASSDTILMAYGVISNGVVTSDDGTTWQAFYIGTDFSAGGLAWGNNRFVAVGRTVGLGPRAIYTTR